MPKGDERVLITGGSGFLGARLARDLISTGDDVHLALRPEANLWRLADLEGQFTPHWADVGDAKALQRTVARCRPEVIYHLATHGAHAFQQDRAAIISTNLMGTANLLEALATLDYRALIYTGSSSEYGHKDGPMRPGDRPEPRSDYAVAKAAASLLCLAEAAKGRPVVCVRVFSAYGPGEEPSRLVPQVMAACLRGEAPRVSAGLQPRDFIYADDLIRLLRTAADCPDARGRILHAGSGKQTCVRDMVETILSVCAAGGLKAAYGAEPTRPDEPTSWVADIEATSAMTGWKPGIDLRQGVERTWAWFLAHEAKGTAQPASLPRRPVAGASR